MILHDSTYTDLATAPIKNATAILTETVVETPLTYTGSDVLVSVSIDSVGMFLGTTTKKAVVKLIGAHTELLGKSFDVQVGLRDMTDGTYYYISEGVFSTNEVAVDYENDTTTVTLYDAMWTAINSEYGNFAFTYPMTVQALASAVAIQLGVTLATGFDSLPNYDYSILVDPYASIDGTKLRDVIEEIAQATATTAIISGTYLKFIPFTTSAETIVGGTLKTLKLNDEYGVINSVVLSRQPQNDDIFLSDTSSIETNGLTEFKIINNQIMDDDRTTLITDIYNALNGVSFYGATMNTTGHGWYEVGDILTIDQGGSTYDIFVTETHIAVDGSMSENVVCTVPSKTTTNYLSAGGILKTIYNTEIKVDKQEQEITSVVSDLATLDDTVSSNYTEINQTINNITQTIQTTGGNNLIKNSVGFGTNTDGTPTSWTKSGTGTVDTNTSSESLSYGAISGNQINLSGTSPKIKQTVVVQAGGKYSMSLRLKKPLTTGTVAIRLKNTTDNFNIAISAGASYLWDKYEFVGITPTLAYFDVEIETASADVSITDLMLVIGDSTMVWQQASGEVANTSLVIDINGVKVKQTGGDFTQITSQEFAGYSSVSGTSQKVFYLNRDVTHTKKFEADDQMSMTPVKIVPITTGTVTGWAFVGTV